jgi:hypothetical protein
MYASGDDAEVGIMSKAPEDDTGQNKPSAVKAERAEREAAALRANLRKRKDQVRLREAAKEKPDR